MSFGGRLSVVIGLFIVAAGFAVWAVIGFLLPQPATVDFTSNPIQVVGASQTLAIAQVVFTATAQPGVNSVVFEIAGQLLDVPIASGATVSGPVDRTFYQPQAPVF